MIYDVAISKGDQNYIFILILFSLSVLFLIFFS